MVGAPDLSLISFNQGVCSLLMCSIHARFQVFQPQWSRKKNTRSLFLLNPNTNFAFFPLAVSSSSSDNNDGSVSSSRQNNVLLLSTTLSISYKSYTILHYLYSPLMGFHIFCPALNSDRWVMILQRNCLVLISSPGKSFQTCLK